MEPRQERNSSFTVAAGVAKIENSPSPASARDLHDYIRPRVLRATTVAANTHEDGRVSHNC